MDTKTLRKGFGAAAGSKAQIAAYHDALLKAADEIDRLRKIEKAAKEVCSWIWETEDHDMAEDLKKLEALIDA